MRIKIIPSKTEIPAADKVNIRAMVTCGLANMVLEVASNNPPTRNPTMILVFHFVECSMKE